MHWHGFHMKPYQGETENRLQGSSATGESEGIQGMDSSVVSPENYHKDLVIEQALGFSVWRLQVL